MRILITGICGFVGSELARGLLERFPNATITGLDNLMRPAARPPGRSCRPPAFTSAMATSVAPAISKPSPTATGSSTPPHSPASWPVSTAAPAHASSSNITSWAPSTSSNSPRPAKPASSFCPPAACTTYRPCAASLCAFPTKPSNSTRAPPLPPGCSPAGISDDFSTAAPISLYGSTKLASEALALEYGQAFNLPVIINRCGVLAGPGQFGTPEQGIFSYWLRAYALRRPLKYIGFAGSGHQVRNALHPADLLELLCRQLPLARDAAGIWTVGGGPANAMSLAQLSRWCAKTFGPHTVQPDLALRPWDVPWVVMDARKTQQRFAWKPVIALADILQQIAEHHRRHPQWLDLSRAL